MTPKPNAGKSAPKITAQIDAQHISIPNQVPGVILASIPMVPMEVDLRTKRSNEPPVDATVEYSPTNAKLAPSLCTADSPKARASKNLSSQLDATGGNTLSDSDDGVPLNERFRQQGRSRSRADAPEAQSAPAPILSRTPATGRQTGKAPSGATATKGVRK